MSVRGGSRVQGLVSVVLVAAFIGGCSSSPPGRPDGGSTGGSGATGGAGGSAGTAGGAGPGGKGGTAGGAGSGGSAGGGLGGAGGAAGLKAGAGGSAAGTGGAAAGSGGSAGGASGSGGASSGSAGAGGMSGGLGSGGAGGLACGDAGKACCAGNSCNNDLLCLNGSTCSCAQALVGRYLLRTDGALLYESDPTSTAQTPVVDGTTGLPLVGMTGVQEGGFHGCGVQHPRTLPGVGGRGPVATSTVSSATARRTR